MNSSQLESYKFVFLDFDGVIKDSVEVKADAFEQLFSSYGEDIVKRLRIHHEANGGVSRYEKLPLYLEWFGIRPDENTIEEFAMRCRHTNREAVRLTDYGGSNGKHGIDGASGRGGSSGSSGSYGGGRGGDGSHGIPGSHATNATDGTPAAEVSFSFSV